MLHHYYHAEAWTGLPLCSIPTVLHLRVYRIGTDRCLRDLEKLLAVAVAVGGPADFGVEFWSPAHGDTA